MSTLLTGGTGFIGAEIVRILVERGERPVLLARNPASAWRLADIADRIDFVPGDLSDFSHVLHAVKKAKPTIIYHLGAMLSIPSEGDPSAAIQSNAMGTFYVLEAARLFDVQQVFFASTGATYGLDIWEKAVTDHTLQRPTLIYGATKVFGEHMGLFYRRKYGLDFRGLRYQSIIGPGVRTHGIVQFTSWVIEESIKGKPYTIQVNPEMRVPMMYVKDAVQATLQLMEAPAENIKTVNYLVNGIVPSPSAAELAEIVRKKVPGARVDFRADAAQLRLPTSSLQTIDDGNARKEWGWMPSYDLERSVDEFIVEMKRHPERYA